MAIISEKSFVNGALKNQNKKTKRPQTSIVNEADFLSRGGEEMDRRRTAFENYKAARAAMQQQAQRQVTQGYERRADAMGTVARGMGRRARRRLRRAQHTRITPMRSSRRSFGRNR